MRGPAVAVRSKAKRRLAPIAAALLAGAAGCGGLNDEQLDYLIRDAKARALFPSELALRFNQTYRYASKQTLQTSTDANAVADAMMARAATLPVCLTLAREGPATFSALGPGCNPPVNETLRLARQGGAMQLDVEPEVSAAPYFGPPRHLRLEESGALTFILELPAPPLEAYPVGTQLLRFEGTVELDESSLSKTATFDGEGVHRLSARPALGYRLEGLRHGLEGCVPLEGQLVLGPRDVFRWAGHSVPTEQRLTYSALDARNVRVDIAIERTTTQAVVTSAGECP